MDKPRKGEPSCVCVSTFPISYIFVDIRIESQDYFIELASFILTHYSQAQCGDDKQNLQQNAIQYTKHLKFLRSTFFLSHNRVQIHTCSGDIDFAFSICQQLASHHSTQHTATCYITHTVHSFFLLEKLSLFCIVRVCAQ